MPKILLTHQQYHAVTVKTVHRLLYVCLISKTINTKYIILPVSFFIWVQVLSGHAVVQLVEALHYELEDRGFNSRWCQWNFSLT